MKKISLLVPLFVFFFIFVLFKSGLGKDPNLLPSLLVNKPLPSFTANLLEDSEQLITDKQLNGKLILLNVWASWCSACRIEHSQLIDLAKSYPIEIIGLDYKDDRAEALQYLAHAGNPYRACIFDPEGKIALQFGVYGTPETFLIDQRGVIRYRYVGSMTFEVIKNDLLPRIKRISMEQA